MGIGGNPAVVVLNQNQVAETFQFVAGISDRALSAALTLVPSAALMFMPSLVRPLPMVPKCEMTVPLTGHKNFVLRYLETGCALLRELWAIFWRLFWLKKTISSSSGSVWFWA